MHRCWSILEIQRAIFHEVDHLSNGKAVLASLARTCRTLNSASLDVLWATLDSFLYLIKCLPSDLWRIELSTRLVVFLRPMSPKDWEVFFLYSNRIRTLSRPSEHASLPTQCQWPAHLTLNDNAVSALSNPPTAGPLCPKLRKLDWDGTDKTHAPLLRLLLTPSLVALSLPFSVLYSPEISILTSIGAACPWLKSLRLTLPMPFTEILDAGDEKILSEALLQLRSLKTVSYPALNEAAFIHLSCLSLVNLTLELPLSFRVEKVKPYMVAPAFASLDSLTLHVRSLLTLTTLLQSLRFKPTFLSFNVADTPTVDGLHHFFLMLVSACDTRELVRLIFTSSGERQRGAPSAPLTLSTFQPLFAFSDIHAFEFDVSCDMALDDDAITAIATQWPNMATLSLNTQSGWGIPSRVTHRGLITLLGRCPALAELALAIDFSAMDLEYPERLGTVRPGGGVSNERCRLANFVTSTIVHPVSIAMFLSDVCPQLLMIQSSWLSVTLRTDVEPEGRCKYLGKWGQVNRLFPAFTAARMQTMNWVLENTSEESDGRLSASVGAEH